MSSLPVIDRIRASLQVYRYSWRAVQLVWTTSRGLTVGLAVLTLLRGLLPAAIAWVGQQIIDGVMVAAETGAPADRSLAMTWVGVEMGLVTALAATQRGLDVIESLLRAQLGQAVNVLILRKALSLDLASFEDSAFYDKMTRARREASTRPLALVRKSFGLARNTLALVTYGGLLLQFSGWIVLVLALAAVPAFMAESLFAAKAFRLFQWKAPETRQQLYLETVMAREDYAKEVKLLNLGPVLLDRYRQIFDRLYGEDRSLVVRRGYWGFVLGLVSLVALYGAYGWIAWAAVAGAITIGQMTMFLVVFKQGQTSFSEVLSAVGGMYEDNLYLSNLYEYLETGGTTASGRATRGTHPGDGIRFENVCFTYPGARSPALVDVSFHITPGQRLALVGHNGSGKTTLVKLLTSLYRPDSGVIRLDGLPLEAWDVDVLRRRIGVIFQDFVRYQLTVGENIGVGDVARLTDREQWKRAAEKGMADTFIDELPSGYETQLGRWFDDGRELSIGQWQKIALSRAFMSEHTDILILDEPTSAMDAEAEARVFSRFEALAGQQMVILISHRFSTVRMADRIVVMDAGHVIEEGDHDTLMSQGGRYARLFELQAAGYS